MGDIKQVIANLISGYSLKCESYRLSW